MRCKIEVIVDYYPKNLFLGNVFNDGKGLLKPRVRKWHLSGLSNM